MPVAVDPRNLQSSIIESLWGISLPYSKLQLFHLQKESIWELVSPDFISLKLELWRDWNQEVGGSVTTNIEQVLKLLAFYGIEVPRPDEIRAYLSKHLDMADLLSAVCLETLHQLGDRVQLSLEVYHDPEIEDEYLVLYARQKEYDEDLLERLDAISNQYEECLVDKSGWLLLTTDFQPPR